MFEINKPIVPFLWAMRWSNISDDGFNIAMVTVFDHDHEINKKNVRRPRFTLNILKGEP